MFHTNTLREGRKGSIRSAGVKGIEGNTIRALVVATGVGVVCVVGVVVVVGVIAIALCLYFVTRDRSDKEVLVAS